MLLARGNNRSGFGARGGFLARSPLSSHPVGWRSSSHSRLYRAPLSALCQKPGSTFLGLGQGRIHDLRAVAGTGLVRFHLLFYVQVGVLVLRKGRPPGSWQGYSSNQPKASGKISEKSPAEEAHSCNEWRNISAREGFDSSISTIHAFSRARAPSMAEEPTFDRTLTQIHADSRSHDARKASALDRRASALEYVEFLQGCLEPRIPSRVRNFDYVIYLYKLIWGSKVPRIAHMYYIEAPKSVL